MNAKRVGIRAGVALVCLGLCGPPALAQPDRGKIPPKQSAATPPIVENQQPLPAFQLEAEQKQGLQDLVALSPWLVVIGVAILLAVIVSTIVLGPEVVWGKKKKKLRSLYKKEARESGRQVIHLDPRDLEG